MAIVLSPETVMACAIVAASNARRPVLIEEVSGLFAKLRQEGVDGVGKVALRKRPHGLYSEDVEAFFGRLLAAGFASAASPLSVNAQGLELCHEMIQEEHQANPQALGKVAKALGFDIGALTCQAGLRSSV